MTDAPHTEQSLAPQGDPTIVLAIVRTPVEEQLVRDWVAASGDPVLLAAEVVMLPRTVATAEHYATLAARLGRPGEVRLIPVGVTWMPGERDDGVRQARASDVLRGGNPYRPGARRQGRIARRDPSRGQVLAGDSATSSELRAAYAESAAPEDALAFARFVGRRGRLALERADSRLLGPQFKSARLVKEELLAHKHFRARLQEFAAQAGPGVVTTDKVETILDELTTGWSRLFIDVFPRVGRAVFQRGFDPQIDTVATEVERLRRTLASRPAVFLWSHRSNLDQPVFTASLHENGLPLPHLFAGINMSFGPMGAIMRRAGVIFIRRKVGSDPLYKLILKEYVGYLAEKRFNLSWSIEGTRSRTGKMLPPKLGLLSYVSEAYLDGRSDDIALQPVSITFDQLHEVGEYAAYARGGTKAPEGFTWLYNFIKAQGQAHYGKIYVRYPEPVSMRAFLGPIDGEIAADPERIQLALNKMAFEVAWRINQAMPVTTTAVLATLLLGTHGMALTTPQVRTALATALDYLKASGAPLAESVANLHTDAGVENALGALAASGLVTRVDGARDRVWSIEPKRQLEASFYRNSIVHHFLTGAICEIAMVEAVRLALTGPERVATFWVVVDQVRDLLKFEFYFRGRADFHEDVAAEMTRMAPDWEAQLRDPSAGAAALLEQRAVLTAPFTVRPFVEAYGLVADVLSHWQGEGQIEADRVQKEALALGEQYLAQQRINSSEPVSALLFATAVQLADNRGVLAEGADRPTRAAQFAAELEATLAAIDTIAMVANTRFAAARRAEHLTERPGGPDGHS